jgi:hypothetical protein
MVVLTLVDGHVVSEAGGNLTEGDSPHQATKYQFTYRLLSTSRSSDPA